MEQRKLEVRDRVQKWYLDGIITRTHYERLMQGIIADEQGRAVIMEPDTDWYRDYDGLEAERNFRDREYNEK